MRFATLGLMALLASGCDAGRERADGSEAAAANAAATDAAAMNAAVTGAAATDSPGAGATADASSGAFTPEPGELESLLEDPVSAAARAALVNRAEQLLAGLKTRQWRLDLSLRKPLQGRPFSSWLDCDGYLTNNTAQGFCEALPPPDWKPFEFQGRRYYYVPLSG